MSSVTRRSWLGAVCAASLVLGLGLAPAAHAAPSEAALEELLAKQAITELLYKYPRALDRLDRELLTSLAHPEATVKFGNWNFKDWKAYVDFMMKAHADMDGNEHRITNILIEVRGDKAVSESTGTATLLVKAEKKPDTYEERWMHSRYLDRWSKRGGRWALDSRITLTDYRRIKFLTADDVKANYQTGARSGRDDASYQLFEGK